MSENTAEKQRISPLISLLLEFLDISRTCMHDHNSYLDPIRHFTSAGKVLLRKLEHASIYTFGVLQIILLAIMYATIARRSREILTQWRSSTKVRSWTVLPRINKVLHTDSLSVESTDAKPGTKPRHYCRNFWQKSLKKFKWVEVGDMSQWRVYLAQTKNLNKKMTQKESKSNTFETAAAPIL